MEQVGEGNKAICQENCGKGFRLSNTIECDDGNLIDGDGCSKDCKIEEFYKCEGGSLS